MGNISRLLGLLDENADAGAGAILRSAKNSIPVFWFGLFEPGDGRAFALALDDGEALPVPGLLTATLAARERWIEREPLLRSWLPESLHHHLLAWRETLHSVSHPYVGLDPAELALVMEDDDLSSWLSQAAGAFATPSTESLITLFDVPGLEFDPSAGRVVDFDVEVVAFSLAGY